MDRRVTRAGGIVAALIVSLVLACVEPVGPTPFEARCYAVELTDSIVWSIFGRTQTFRYRDARCPPFRWRAPDSASRARAARERQ